MLIGLCIGILCWIAYIYGNNVVSHIAIFFGIPVAIIWGTINEYIVLTIFGKVVYTALDLGKEHEATRQFLLTPISVLIGAFMMSNRKTLKVVATIFLIFAFLLTATFLVLHSGT